MALHIDWTDEARADIRALDRSTAMRIFEGLHRYALTGEGDVKKLQGKHAGKLRLRLGDLTRLLSARWPDPPHSRRQESQRRLPLKLFFFSSCHIATGSSYRGTQVAD
jgi:mRNA-degrading endonuclease RelE of RelBE toxin-antitoxin system